MKLRRIPVRRGGRSPHLRTPSAAAALLALGVLTGASGRAEAGKLYVFLHTSVKAKALEATLEKALPGTEVTAFGRIRDLEKQVKAAPPDAVMARAPVLEKLGLKPAVQGTLSANPAEKMVLLSLEAVTPAEVASKVVGAIDILGRGETGKYFGVMLGADGKVKLKRVTKLEDLLPLLQFKAADAVIVSESEADALTAKTKMGLTKTPIPSASIGLPAVGFTARADEALIKALVGMKRPTASKIGVDGWRKN